MAASSQPGAGRPSAAIIERQAFWITAVLAGASFWIAPRPPMGDLPQHAGQIALWHDLLRGTSPWQHLFGVNYFTPYLIGNGLALLLSFIMPVAAALKLLLSLAYLGFVASCTVLRRSLKGDARLDWLFVTGFFGLAYAHGFFPFLVALPVGVIFIWLGHRHAERPSLASAIWLSSIGVLLFFSHGLLFVFAGAVGGAFLLLKRLPPMPFAIAAVPYAGFAVLCVLYYLLHDTGGMSPGRMELHWQGPVSVLKYLLAFPLGVPGNDWLLAALVPLSIAVPLLAGYRIDRRRRAALAPAGVLLVWCFVVPDSFMDTWFMGARFAVFLLPFYALTLVAPAGPSRLRLGLPLLCWAFLAIHAERLVAFAREAAAFDEMLAAAEPGHRLRNAVEDHASTATHNLVAYGHFPLWYQVEKTGLVDFNFAYFASSLVRYRAGQAPAATAYRYYIVRNARAVPEKFLTPGACPLALRMTAGEWSLFEAAKC